jgi:2-polyprenyl-3-methyl-5-hydroxy-6-metoxy-1,4-benzoquinol methylase/uncharacterized protein YbaR (Trm112 family)
MRRRLLDLLVCPTCEVEAPLTLAGAVESADEIMSGELRCTKCAAVFPVRNGIPRFVPEDDDYCKNFGYQWQRWQNVQIDRLGNHKMSENRFFTEVPWDRAWLDGKLVLEAGCGAGRFTDVAAAYGPEIVACDISSAIDACRITTSRHGARVHHVQASIYALPFRKQSFDATYCLGVIQHTPDPTKTMSTLPAFLKPGGMLAYDFYEDNGWARLGAVKYALRRITPDLPNETTLLLSRALTAMFFPLGATLARLPLLNILVGTLPIALVYHPDLTLKQQLQWTLLDTFDWYGPRYEIRQEHKRVVDLLRSLKLDDVRGRQGCVTARAPSV